MSSCLVFLLLITLSPELGKVVIQTGVGEAEFYLDGTFVAKSNANGLLTIESFPAGSFRFAVKKPGFVTYEGFFTVAEGETKDLALKLQPMRSEVRGPRSRTARGPRAEARDPRSKEKSEPQTAAGKDQQRPDTQPSAAAGDSSAGTWVVLGTLVFIPVAGSVAWKLYQKKVRGPRSAVRNPEVAPEDELTEERKWAPIAPDFIEGLKRKEDLIKAGFIGTRPSEFDRQAVAGKEKEVVIVLPKEAYHYEEEK